MGRKKDDVGYEQKDVVRSDTVERELTMGPGSVKVCRVCGRGKRVSYVSRVCTEGACCVRASLVFVCLGCVRGLV